MDHERTIVHIDIDCFYAQVEMIRNPSLKDRALGIQQKYLLVTCNYEARKRGVTKLMSLTEAKKKCPDLVVVNGEDLTNYRRMSYQISEYLQTYSQCVERLGFDENFVDVTEMVKTRLRDGTYEKHFIGHVYDAKDTVQDSLWNPPCTCGCNLQLQIGSQIAADIRKGLEHDLSITCCAGIAHNKLLAKLVGSINKPSQQTTMLPHLACQLMSSLDGVRAIPGIGSRTSKRLNTLEIHSVSDLRQSPLLQLEQEFGQMTASLLLKLAVGIDESPVVTFALPQTLSDEDSFKCCSKMSDARSRIEALVESLLERLRDDGRIPHTLRLSIRRTNYRRESRQCSVQESVFTKFYKTGETEAAKSYLLPRLMSLFSKMVNAKESFHLTLINVCFAKLAKPPQNKLSSFFNQQSQKFVGMDGQALECKGISFIKREVMKNNPGDRKEPINIPCETSKDSLGTMSEPTLSTLVKSNQETLKEVIDEKQGKVTVSAGHDKDICKAKLQHLLPSYIDAQTILELPDSIQDEILSEHGINLECTPTGEKTYVLSQGKITRSKFSHARKPLFSPKEKGQKCSGVQVIENSKELSHMEKQVTVMSSVEPRLEEGHPDQSARRKKDIAVISKVSHQVDIDHGTGLCEEKFPVLLDTENDLSLSSKILNGGSALSASIDPSGTCSDDCKNEWDMPFKSATDFAKIAKDDKLQMISVQREVPSTTTSRFHPKCLGKSEYYLQCSIPSTTESEALFTACESHSKIQGAPDLTAELNRSKQGFCPQGIDPEVFAALPTNIRGEIMAHTVMGTGDAFLSNRAPAKNTRIEKKKKEQKTLLAFFRKT